MKFSKKKLYILDVSLAILCYVSSKQRIIHNFCAKIIIKPVSWKLEALFYSKDNIVINFSKERHNKFRTAITHFGPQSPEKFCLSPQILNRPDT